MTSLSQTKVIHTLKARQGLPDADYRDLLQARYQVKSSTDLTQHQAADLIDKLGGGSQPASSTRATGRFAPILQALWLAGWNLGVIHVPDDTAMMAFVKRQTGLDHTRFLTEPLAAKRAIEGLKDWLAREADVVWPAAGLGGDAVLEAKKAVTKAIAVRLVMAGGFVALMPHLEPTGWPTDFEYYGHKLKLPGSFDAYTGQHWDRLANALGSRLRATLAAKRRGETT